MIKTFEASGKTVEEAIDSALLLAGTTIENVDIEVLELGGRGVFGFGKKDARVRISLEVEEETPLPKAVVKESRPARQPKPKAEVRESRPDRQPKPKAEVRESRPDRQPKPKAEEKPASTQPAEDEAPVVKEMIRTRSRRNKEQQPQERKEFKENNKENIKENRENRAPKQNKDSAESAEAKAAKRAASERGYRVGEGEEAASLAREAMAFLNPIFHSLKVQPQQETQVKEGILWLVFSGQGLGSLIGRRGETLNALQYLTNLAVNRDKKEHVRLVLDVQGYRAGREETLVALAKKMADKAARSGRRVELEPMNPHERRIVHIALQNDKRVDTMSQGEEPYRHVVINRRRSEHNKDHNHNQNQNQNQNQNRKKPAAAPKGEEKLSFSQQLGQQFTEQMDNRK